MAFYSNYFYLNPMATLGRFPLSQNWLAAEKSSRSCILLRIWLIWLDSFDKKWNFQYDENGLARRSSDK